MCLALHSRNVPGWSKIHLCISEAYSAKVSLSPRGTSGGRVGEGGGRASLCDVASSPRPSPPAGDAGEEREKRQQCVAKQTYTLTRRVVRTGKTSRPFYATLGCSP